LNHLNMRREPIPKTYIQYIKTQVNKTIHYNINMVNQLVLQSFREMCVMIFLLNSRGKYIYHGWYDWKIFSTSPVHYVILL
jgi:hypothetical protein